MRILKTRVRTFTNSARGKASEEYALRVTVPLGNVRRSRRAHPASAVENDLLIGPWLFKPVLLLELLRGKVERGSKLRKREIDGGRYRALKDFIGLPDINQVFVLRSVRWRLRGASSEARTGLGCVVFGFSSS